MDGFSVIVFPLVVGIVAVIIVIIVATSRRRRKQRADASLAARVDAAAPSTRPTGAGAAGGTQSGHTPVPAGRGSGHNIVAPPLSSTTSQSRGSPGQAAALGEQRPFSSSPVGGTTAGRDPLRLKRRPGEKTIQVFISHSSEDHDLARLLADLLRSALRLDTTTIRCTSVDGYRLPGGADFTERIREEVRAAPVFIALISNASARSPWVLSELGARWGTGAQLLPVLAPGVSASILQGPLAELNALRCDNQAQLHQLVYEVADLLGLAPQPPALYQGLVEQVSQYIVKPAG